MIKFVYVYIDFQKYMTVWFALDIPVHVEWFWQKMSILLRMVLYQVIITSFWLTPYPVMH